MSWITLVERDRVVTLPTKRIDTFCPSLLDGARLGPTKFPFSRDFPSRLQTREAVSRELIS